MPTETTVLHSSEETNPILDRAKEKLKEELKEAEKALVDANTKLGALGESASEEDKAKAIDELTKAKAKVDDLKEKLKAAEGTHEDGEVTPSPVVPGAGAVESPTTGGTETQPQPKEDEGHKPAPSTGGTETKPVSPTPGSEEGHGTTETHEGTPAGSETHTETPGPTGDHLEDHTTHTEEGKHEETHEEKKPSVDEAALKAKAEEAKAKVEETTKEAAKAEAAANPANKLGGVAFALASGAYRML